MLTNPCGFFQDFYAGQLCPLDGLAHGFTLGHHFNASCHHHFCARCLIFIDLRTIGKHEQFGLFALGIPPFSNSDVILHNPIRVRITSSTHIKVTAIVCIGVLSLKFLLTHYLSN